MADKYDAFLDSDDARIDAFLDADVKPAVSPAPTSEKPMSDLERFRKSQEEKQAKGFKSVAELLAGMTSVPRGALNLVKEGLGESIFPTKGLDKESGAYTVGQILDPAAWAVGGGAMKAAQQLPKVLPKAGAITQGVVGGGVGGGVVGATQGEGAGGAGIGAAIGGGIPAIGVAISKLTPVARNVLNSISATVSKGGRASVGQRMVLDQLPPSERDEVLRILQAQGADISPFSQLTSAEAIAQQNLGRAVKSDAGAGIAALEESISREPASRAIRSAREQRTAGIEDVFGTLTRGRGIERQAGLSPEDVARQALEQQRTATAKQLAPKGDIAGDERLNEIMSRPAVETAERVVGTAEANIPKQMVTQASRPADTLMGTPKEFEKYSIESLANRYRSMEAAANRLMKTGRDEEANAIRAAKNDLGAWLRDKVPDWDMFQKAYAYQSRPINQSEVATDLMQRARSGDVIFGDKSSRGQFLGATEDIAAQEAQVRGVLGRAGTPLSKIFDPKQMSKIEGLRTEAQIYDEVERLRGLVKPKTEGEKPFQLPNLLNAWVAVANRILREGGKATIDDVTEEAAKVLADPNKFRNLLMKDAAQRAKVGKVPVWAGGAGVYSAPVTGMLTGE